MRPADGGRWQAAVCALLVVVLTSAYFAANLDAEPFYLDESAYIRHSYYYRLFTTGAWNHPDWLHFAARDSPPFFKYLIGLGLAIGGHEVPRSIGPAQDWYDYGFDPRTDPWADALTAARVPLLLAAVLGGVMLFWLGWAWFDLGTGLFAAGLLALSPAYATHARRAMGDDLAQALVATGLVGFTLFASQLEVAGRSVGRRCAGVGLIGLGCGLAAASKLTGITGVTVVSAAMLLFFLLTLAPLATKHVVPGRRRWQLLAGGGAGVLLGGTLFIAMNPYFYAQPNLATASPAPRRVVHMGNNTVVEPMVMVAGTPWTVEALVTARKLAAAGIFGRLRAMIDYRRFAQGDLMNAYPDQALPTVASRGQALLFQALGRWSAAGRLGPRLGPLAAAFLVLAGSINAAHRGWKRWRGGGWPLAWILLLWAGIEGGFLLTSLTLDWERYYLGLLVLTSLLMAAGITGTLNGGAAVMAGWRGQVAKPTPPGDQVAPTDQVPVGTLPRLP